MTRMPMPRDKAAPMDWERENSLSFPNALDSSDSTGFDVQNHQSNSGMKAPSSLFGQQSTNNTPPRTGSFGKGVEPPAQPKRPFSDVWGSATPRPLHQDSLQGSSGFNPPQPPALGGPLFFGNVKRASTFSEQSTNTRESTPGNQSAPFKPTLERSKTQGTSTSNKDQSSFFTFPSSTPKSHILDDQDNQGFDPDITSPTSSALPLTTSGFWGSNRSSTMADEIMKGTHELSIGGRSRPLATGAIKRVLRNRNSMGESEYWNVHADDSLYHQHPSDSETENGHYSHRRESKICPATTQRSAC
ncbi:hypothetical protein BGW41_004006 [Actinomortierella wolfii]|nr:hypothetical protein BGW41_004006 [Actinomortierella wolfii]